MLFCASTTELRQQRAAAGPCPDRCTSDGKAQVRHGAVGMRSHGLAGILGLAVTLIVSAAGCTASPPRPPAANSPTQGTAIGSSRAACTRTEITAAVARFFGRWNQHDTAAFGQLFDANGVLDMATKHQDTLAGHGAWVSSGGQDAIKAFAARQWTLGEKLSYRGISVITGGGSVGDGGYAGHVLATFTDRTRQP
jgi:hypothetical protein